MENLNFYSGTHDRRNAIIINLENTNVVFRSNLVRISSLFSYYCIL